ncbi:putative nuclease HARBI1 [Photinus pyralis]|uniref:putative nuclease HARBI1 n=1 Tax=Photinus pyralis TaxID=7054 RepID=UPI0012671D98|nr:putative nuclease HARBI1 [Photinus pyralis]
MDAIVDDILEDDLDILEVIDFGFPRMLYTRSDYFHSMDEYNFFKRFRLTKQTCLRVLIYIEEELEFPNNTNHSVSPMNQLLVTLRFYASSGHLTAVADFAGIHTSTASRIIPRVSEAIARLRPQFIKMPENANELQRIQNEFFEISAFPRVVGVIDCTHIKIQSPGGNDGEIFRNRKSYFSLNVQAISNANLEIMDIVCRWPGSAHDSTIFNSSRIRARMENGEFPNSILLGDSGYPLRDYFLTPLANPRNRAEQVYNDAHIRTRNIVERLFGNCKRRFPVLAYGIRLKLHTVFAVIVATAVLQNIARSMNDMQPPPLPEDIHDDELSNCRYSRSTKYCTFHE